MSYSLLYRGLLRSCNYGCGYCPFEKRPATLAEVAADRQGLQRLTTWARQQPADSLGILFTPWGEILDRPSYRRAIIALSHLAAVRKVAVQTNLATPLSWLTEVRADRVAFWATYHPGVVTRDRFLRQCTALRALGIAFSVGAVGLRSDIPAILAMRQALPGDVYLWVNAYKEGGADYYPPEEIAALGEVDPLFEYNLSPHHSLGQACRTGETVFAVDHLGDLRRCHFVDEVLGNLHRDDLERLARPSPCPNATCGCHIGYVHMPGLGLDAVFGDGILERIPRRQRG